MKNQITVFLIMFGLLLWVIQVVNLNRGKENNVMYVEQGQEFYYGGLAIQADEFLLLDSDEYGTYFNVMKTNKEIFNYKDNKTNSYKLKVKFPKVYDSFDYQDIVEAIFLEVDSKQLIN